MPAVKASAASNLEKENRRPAAEAIKGKAATKDVPAPRMRRALTDRGNLGAPGDDKKGSPSPRATATPARGRAVAPSGTTPTTPRAASAGRPLSATGQRGRLGSGGANSAATTPRTRKGPAAVCWADVENATAAADKLEAQVAALDAEVAAAEAEALDAEAKEREAEQMLTSKSAEMLSEYANAHERFRTLEEELRTTRERLDTLRKENLELSRRNIELDRSTKNCKAQIEEAKTLLERCTSSQGTLDAEIAERLAECERLRQAAEGQRERLLGDLRRFSAMKARLLELVDATGVGADRQKEVQQLIADADSMAEKTSATLEECSKVVLEGIVPPEVSADAQVGDCSQEACTGDRSETPEAGEELTGDCLAACISGE
eukprot:TRINITY_DN2712_c0_g1_i2.p1 TRINITY_DN2712_c0_g1~~TRINITY_DN2712_c0_g1_i2.p1  ORF type:complete len:401 (-),score=107.03 TRINITY_DN2712_c0_g1_i2:54-1184(-)